MPPRPRGRGGSSAMLWLIAVAAAGLIVTPCSASRKEKSVNSVNSSSHIVPPFLFVVQPLQGEIVNMGSLIIARAASPIITTFFNIKNWYDSALLGTKIACDDLAFDNLDLKKSANVSPDDFGKLANDPVRLRQLMRGLLGILIQRSQLKRKCMPGSWMSWMSESTFKRGLSRDSVLMALDKSMEHVQSEMDLDTDNIVYAIKRLADFVVSILLKKTCRLLSGVDSDTQCGGDGAALLSTVQTLENTLLTAGMFKKVERLPSLNAMREIIEQSEVTRELARHIVQLSSVLFFGHLDVAQEYAQSGDFTVMAQVAFLRERSWGCGQMSSVTHKGTCQRQVLSLHVPADDKSNDKSQGNVAQIFGSRFVTALLVYYPDPGVMTIVRPFRFAAKVRGGLGRAAGDDSRLLAVQTYWDPKDRFVDWTWLGNRFWPGVNVAFDLAAIVKLGEVIVMGATLIHYAPVRAAAFFHRLGVLPGAREGLNIVFRTITSELGGFVNSALWILWRIASGVMYAEDCMCGMLGAVAHHVQVINVTEVQTMVGYDMCFKGFQGYPTHRVVKARRDADKALLTLQDYANNPDCRLTGAWCDEPMIDSYCEIELLAEENEERCWKGRDDEERPLSELQLQFLGTGGVKDEYDGHVLFQVLCANWKSKIAKVRAKAKYLLMEADVYDDIPLGACGRRRHLMSSAALPPAVLGP